ncbi:MAG: hypothetical protein JKX97_02630 [Candidatus Lindowbacteria bacterium]|nr:hypothetical protein [Candidatus Lindowbacteria bacterium]
MTSVSCASISQSAKHSLVTPPEHISSLVFLSEEDQKLENLQQFDYLDIESKSSFIDFFESYEEKPDYIKRLASKSLKRVARKIQKLRDPSIKELVDTYGKDLKKIASKYKEIEAQACNKGIKENNFRKGAGITATTTFAALGGLHLLKPKGFKMGLFGTRFGAGYDIGQIDNPKLLVSLGTDFGMTISAKGISGEIHGENGIYQLGVDIPDQAATAAMSFRNGWRFGSIVSYPERKVTSQLSMGF